MQKERSITLIFKWGIFIIFLFSILTISSAQVPDEVKKNLRIPNKNEIQIITTRDKSTLMGQIVEIRDQDVQFRTEFGVITVPIQKIKSIEIVPSSWVGSFNLGSLFISMGNSFRFKCPLPAHFIFL